MVVQGVSKNLEKYIDVKQTIYQIVTAYPEIVEILKNIGFTEIIKPGMISTMGRFMTLKQGCSLRKIDYDQLKTRLSEQGYILKEDDL